MGRVRAAQKLSGTIRELGERKAGGKRLSGKNIYSQTPDRGAKRGRKVIRLLYPAAKRALRTRDFNKDCNGRKQECKLISNSIICSLCKTRLQWLKRTKAPLRNTCYGFPQSVIIYVHLIAAFFLKCHLPPLKGRPNYNFTEKQFYIETFSDHLNISTHIYHVKLY